MQALEEGQRFERYRVQRRLGSSVSGASYEAEDTLLQRKVTLKLIHPWATLQDAARRQFFREMQGIGELTHPCLAAVLDYGEVDGRLYIARRYVTPGSLLGDEGRYWFQPPLDISRAVHCTYQLAEALQYIHNNGFLHGSLTFANILVLCGIGEDNDPFLIADVGTTHFVRRFGQLQSAVLPITAAPEQFGQRVMPASDQYALAVILYFWLTGCLPFLGTPEEIEQLKLTEKLTTLTSLNLNIPLELEGVIRRALRVYPEERYPSILAFADALQASIARLVPTSPLPVAKKQTEVVPHSIEATPEPAMLDIAESEQIEQISIAYNPVNEPIFAPVQQNGEEVLKWHENANGATRQHAWTHDQVFRDSPTSILELLSMGVLPPEPVLRVDQPTQPAQPIIPEPSAQPETPVEPAQNSASSLYQDVEEGEAELAVEEASGPLQASFVITSVYIESSQEVVIERAETTLGRAGSSDILLDQGVLTSRHHALLKQEGDHYFIYDQRSANGVMVNGEKIVDETAYEIKDGDHIVIGEYELVFHLKPSSQDAAGALYIS